jgi:hypothetical protein
MATAAHDVSLELYQRTQTAVEIRAQVNLIQEVMRAVMKENTHYGIIPGCQKPSLWKPGAEVLFATFRVSVDPTVEDLSTRDEARFRVTARGVSTHGVPLGSAVGEASSDEEKYKWREVVCLEEWDGTPEDRRRLKWKRGNPRAYSIQQVRTNIADCRNTILKMAVKRAYVALALQVTAASDIFTQDIEDIPEEALGNEEAAPTPLPTEIKKKEAAPVPPQGSGTASLRMSAPVVPQAAVPLRTPSPAPRAERPSSPAPQTSVRFISEAQGRRFFAKWKSSGKSQDMVNDYLRSIGATSSKDIPSDRYDLACAWADGDF